MVMRISENIKFNTIVDNMFKSQNSYNKLAEKIASLKKINRPSDDPIGMSRVLNLRESRASIGQYTRNMDSCESWLTITESKLSAAGDLLAKAREVAVAQSTATSSAESRSSEAETVQQLIDEMLALANSKYDGRYLFSGAKAGEVPFSSSERTVATLNNPVKADGNAFVGTVAVTSDPADYSESVNKTYVVKIDTGGALGAAKYQVSSLGGKKDTWSEAVFVPVDGEITLGLY
ncbi:MAG: flagellar hook-associated protein FlgL [Deltaproteobacteria bacterium]|nr:flagellar hook-associated protein FlgL [Deltaproteobacteria bacterium]